MLVVVYGGECHGYTDNSNNNWVENVKIYIGENSDRGYCSSAYYDIHNNQKPDYISRNEKTKLIKMYRDHKPTGRPQIPDSKVHGLKISRKGNF